MSSTVGISNVTACNCPRKKLTAQISRFENETSLQIKTNIGNFLVLSIYFEKVQHLPKSHQGAELNICTSSLSSFLLPPFFGNWFVKFMNWHFFRLGHGNGNSSIGTAGSSESYFTIFRVKSVIFWFDFFSCLRLRLVPCRNSGLFFVI